MAVAGRKPAPAALKLLKGTRPGHDSGDRKVKEPPKFVRSAPTAPSWLSREAKAEWRRVVPELDRLKLLKRPSRASLSTYCETWATFVEATKAIHTLGLTQISTTTRKDGSTLEKPMANPAVSVQLHTQAAIRAWSAEFGLTPSSEGRLTVPEAEVGAEDFD